MADAGASLARVLILLPPSEGKAEPRRGEAAATSSTGPLADRPAVGARRAGRRSVGEPEDVGRCGRWASRPARPATYAATRAARRAADRAGRAGLHAACSTTRSGSPRSTRRPTGGRVARRGGRLVALRAGPPRRADRAVPPGRRRHPARARRCRRSLARRISTRSSGRRSGSGLRGRPPLHDVRRVLAAGARPRGAVVTVRVLHEVGRPAPGGQPLQQGDQGSAGAGPARGRRATRARPRPSRRR